MTNAPLRNPYYELGSRMISLLKRYHAYEVQGLENIPSEGGVLIVVSHSFATYDSLMLGAEIFARTGRYPSGLADRRIFQTPGFAQFFEGIGLQEGSPGAATSLLRQGKIVMVSPGGMREAIRSSDEKYRVNWSGRLGFVRLAIQTQTPILLAACPSADDLYTLYQNPITPAVYKHFKWPLPIFRGFGLTMIPRPVKLTHYMSEPFQPPALRGAEVDEADVRHFHARLEMEMRSLLRREPSGSDESLERS